MAPKCISRRPVLADHRAAGDRREQGGGARGAAQGAAVEGGDRRARLGEQGAERGGGTRRLGLAPGREGGVVPALHAARQIRFGFAVAHEVKPHRGSA